MSDDTKSEIQVHTTDEAHPFREGDVVQLRSGGPSMTFREYTVDGPSEKAGFARCMYMTRDGMKYETLPVTMLRFARPDSPGSPAN